MLVVYLKGQMDQKNEEELIIRPSGNDILGNMLIFSHHLALISFFNTKTQTTTTEFCFENRIQYHRKQ